MKSIGHSVMTRRALSVFVALILVGGVVARTADEQDFQKAKLEYEQAIPSGEETARLQYVSKLAQIIDRNVTERWRTGHPNADYLKIVDAIHAELKKHPTSKDSDSKKLSQLLVGQWQSPRHVYIFRGDGKYGVEDGPGEYPVANPGQPDYL
jgi:hypothetical protein